MRPFGEGGSLQDEFPLEKVLRIEIFWGAVSAQSVKIRLIRANPPSLMLVEAMPVEAQPMPANHASKALHLPYGRTKDSTRTRPQWTYIF